MERLSSTRGGGGWTGGDGFGVKSRTGAVCSGRTGTVLSEEGRGGPKRPGSGLLPMMSGSASFLRTALSKPTARGVER